MKFFIKAVESFDSQMDGIKTRIRREISVFRQLSRENRLLLTCSALFWLANPLIGLFLNIYLWRETADLQKIALFNLFTSLGLPIGFIINGFLFRKISHKRAFQVGLLLQGAFPLILIILQERAFSFLYPLGFINGLSASFYWANLNLLTYDLTKDEIRGYFAGFDSMLTSLVGIFASPFAGLIISTIGPRWLFLSLRGSYYLAFFVATLIFIISVVVTSKIVCKEEKLEFSLRSISLKTKSKKWSSVRFLNVASGFYWGVLFFSFGLLAFRFFGKELNVGWFNGLLSIIYALIGYLAGRLAWPERRFRVAFIGTVFFCFGSLFFAASFSLIGLFVFSIFAALGDIFLWTVHHPIEMKEMDSGYLPKNRRYDYTVDIEVSLNIGRVLGMMVFIFLTKFFDFDSVYRILMVIVAFVPFLGLKAIKNLAENNL